jgi:predicted metal-dependent hydrolase
MINYEISQLMKFLDAKKEWLLKTSEYYEGVQNEYGDENLRPGIICFLGKRYNLQITKDVVSSVILLDNLKKVTFHVTDKRRLKYDLKQWYITQTSKIVSERLNLIRGIQVYQYIIMSQSKSSGRDGLVVLRKEI